jgi:hypothetical protein
MAADQAGLGIPAYMVADFEGFCHIDTPPQPVNSTTKLFPGERKFHCAAS